MVTIKVDLYPLQPQFVQRYILNQVIFLIAPSNKLRVFDLLSVLYCVQEGHFEKDEKKKKTTFFDFNLRF